MVNSPRTDLLLYVPGLSAHIRGVFYYGLSQGIQLNGTSERPSRKLFFFVMELRGKTTYKQGIILTLE